MPIDLDGNEYTRGVLYSEWKRLRGIKRNKLACAVCAGTAVLFVSLAALLLMVIANFISLFLVGTSLDDSGMLASRAHPFMYGATIATFAGAMNFIFFYVSVPITWAAISFSVGRLVHRKIQSKWAYLRWMTIWGAILVGTTCIIAGAMAAADQNTAIGASWALFGGIGTGLLIGAVAGFANGWLFILILRPQTQLKARTTEIADAF